MQKQLIIQIDSKLKEKFKKACEAQGQTMTGYLKLKVLEKVRGNGR